MSSMIFAMQMGIWIIIAVMILLVVIYMYIVMGSQQKSNKTRMKKDENLSFFENNDFESDGLNNSIDEDEGPIQHL